jgi:hypothetical protein
MPKHYINLTSGIEWIPKLKVPYSFIRIQSTACEQKRWDFILQDLDNDLLMNLALGVECIIYDVGAKKESSRACYQGISWINYALSRRWLDIENIAFVHTHDVTRYFSEQYKRLNEKTKLKLDYFKKFLNTKTIELFYISDSAEFKDNLGYYNKILKTH